MQRALVIDDSMIVVAVMEGMLTNAGWEVQTADGGEAGLKVLDTFAAELVICDLRMPKMDGIEVTRRVRARFPLLPLLILTDHAEVAQVVTAMREGAYGYILKGSPEEMLLAEIQGAVEHGRLLEKNRRLEETNAAYQRHLEAMVTEKTDEILRLQRTRSQAEKMGALNNLVAGLAHEVNNPLAVVKSSLSWAMDLSHELVGDKHKQPGPRRLELDAAGAEELDDLPTVIQEAMGSADRIARTIKTLKRLIQLKPPSATSELASVLRNGERAWRAACPPGVKLEWADASAMPRVCLGDEDMLTPA